MLYLFLYNCLSLLAIGSPLILFKSDILKESDKAIYEDSITNKTEKLDAMHNDIQVMKTDIEQIKNDMKEFKNTFNKLINILTKK